MKRNIFVLAHRVPYPPNKGEKLRTFHQIRHFVTEGSDVTVFVPLSDLADEKDLISLENELGVRVVGVRNQFRYINLFYGLICFKPLSISNFYVPALQKAIDEHLTRGTVDAVLCTSSCMAEYIFRSKAKSILSKLSPRLVMDFMDLDSDKWQQYTDLRGFPRSLIYRREARVLRKYECRIHDAFDACVFVSSNEVAMLEINLGLSSDKLHAIGNGIDKQYFYPPAEPKLENVFHLLFVGVMDYFPNEDAMTWFVNDMWPNIRKNYPTAKLSIVGMKPSSRVYALGKTPGVEIVGYVDDVLPWFHSATVFVAPFRVARGIQNKILQAMATGIPVVTTSLGAEGLNCTDGIELLVANDAEAFVEHVDSLLASPPVRHRLCEHGLALISKECSWNNLNDKLSKLT